MGIPNLEMDLESGKRGHRYSHVDELLCRLTGAEAAAVVNNNAGCRAAGIDRPWHGGAKPSCPAANWLKSADHSACPDVMEAGGVALREVGTTNKTHLHDYSNAISPETGLLLKVHTSNYRILGFYPERYSHGDG